MAANAWEEVALARQEKRRELVLSGKAVSDRVLKTGLDPNIFALESLNFLDISSASLPAAISPDIGNLVNLTNLVLKNNNLESLPPTLSLLSKLKLLDVSQNRLSSLPAMSGLHSLTSLNVSINRISGDLPDDCGLQDCGKLASVDLSVNEITGLGGLLEHVMEHLAEVQASKNQICSLSPSISKNWPSVKKLDLSQNRLTAVPGELADCARLKELALGENPLADNRLRKMAAQKGTKSVLDYVRQNCPRAGAGGAGADSKSAGSKKSKKSKAKDAAAAAGKDDEDVKSVCDSLSVLTVNEANPVIVATPAVKDVRPYIVCCVVRGVSLEGDNMRRFIKLQTALHNGVCEKRTVGTIATHDLDLVRGDSIVYTALPPEELSIQPLNAAGAVRSDKLVKHLKNEAEAARKDKKRSQISGLHQYLHILDRSPLYACLKDGEDNTISFPPVTNSNITKISDSTRNILVEVTSNAKLATAKTIADTLLREMVGLGIGEGGSMSLSVEQMKVVDEEGSLKVVYPSKTDLIFEGPHNIVIDRK